MLCSWRRQYFSGQSPERQNSEYVWQWCCRPAGRGLSLPGVRLELLYGSRAIDVLYVRTLSTEAIRSDNYFFQFIFIGYLCLSYCKGVQVLWIMFGFYRSFSGSEEKRKEKSKKQCQYVRLLTDTTHLLSNLSLEPATCSSSKSHFLSLSLSLT